MSAASAENRISRRGANEPAIDWREPAQDAWSDPAWREAAAHYQRKRGKRPLVVETGSQRLPHLRRLLDENVSLERAWSELNQRPRSDAPQTTVEALLFSLRDGTAALGRPAALRRLSELSDAQLREVAVRVQKFKPEIAQPWRSEEVAVLIAARTRVHA
jgi:hypothetical protein